MPLPPALLARLKRRGIVKEKPVEEVIAENYDLETTTGQGNDRKKSGRNDAGAPGCPNKWNPYHYCVQFCYEHWKDGTSENKLPQKYTEQRLKVLKKYPLPPGWKEVYDAGCARHYYWCPRTDEVSWLPPRHPLAVIGDAAPKISKEYYEKGENTNGLDKKDEKETKDDEKEVYREDRGGRIHREDRTRRRRKYGSGSESDGEKGSGSDEEGRPELSDRDKLKRARRKGIDPMDPAAYGDNVPIGTWSSGLHAHDKSGADVTATGPLFQQRPYPAPGAVLRRQQQQRQGN
uniref:WW domain-containing protein n=1 Tax=Syphacia muris TaxID=451379 RepID=A0A0N5ARX4_9BILA